MVWRASDEKRFPVSRITIRTELTRDQRMEVLFGALLLMKHFSDRDEFVTMCAHPWEFRGFYYQTCFNLLYFHSNAPLILFHLLFIIFVIKDEYGRKSSDKIYMGHLTITTKSQSAYSEVG